MIAAIPAMLHQTWRTAELPPRFAKWRTAWRTLHPRWEHRFYDDGDIRRVIADRMPGYLATFDRLPRQIQRVDLFRYLIVHLDGGMYADIDTKPFRPSDHLLQGADCVMCVEFHLTSRRQAMLGYRHPWQISNCIFAAAPAHPFIGALIERIARYAQTPVKCDDDVEDTTGPRMLTRLAFELSAAERGSMKILPQIAWMAPRELPRIGPFASRIHATHYNTGTWRTHRPMPVPAGDLVKAWVSKFAFTGPEFS